MFGQAGMHPLFSLLTESSISWGLNKDSNFSGNGHGMAVGFGGRWALILGKTQELPASLQPVADLLSAWHNLCISFHTLLLGWGRHRACISGGLGEEVELFLGLVCRSPQVQSHLALTFPPLLSPYSSWENVRLHLEEYSQTFDCNLCKGL